MDGIRHLCRPQNITGPLFGRIAYLLLTWLRLTRKSCIAPSPARDNRYSRNHDALIFAPKSAVLLGKQAAHLGKNMIFSFIVIPEFLGIPGAGRSKMNGMVSNITILRHKISHATRRLFSSAASDFLARQSKLRGGKLKRRSDKRRRHVSGAFGSPALFLTIASRAGRAPWLVDSALSGNTLLTVSTDTHAKQADKACCDCRCDFEVIDGFNCNLASSPLYHRPLADAATDSSAAFYLALINSGGLMRLKCGPGTPRLARNWAAGDKLSWPEKDRAGAAKCHGSVDDPQHRIARKTRQPLKGALQLDARERHKTSALKAQLLIPHSYRVPSILSDFATPCPSVKRARDPVCGQRALLAYPIRRKWQAGLSNGVALHMQRSDLGSMVNTIIILSNRRRFQGKTAASAIVPPCRPGSPFIVRPRANRPAGQLWPNKSKRDRSGFRSAPLRQAADKFQAPVQARYGYDRQVHKADSPQTKTVAAGYALRRRLTE